MCSEQLFIPEFEQSNFLNLLYILDFNKVEVAFNSVDHRKEKNHFESKSRIKSNLDLIEIRNKKQNTHVMLEKHLKNPE